MGDQSDLDRAMTLSEMAPDSSVTFGVLAGRDERFAGTRLHEPPVSYLEDTEAPAYVLTNEKRGIGVGTKRNTTTPASDRGTVVMVTGRRTLCLIGGESDDEVIEVPHETLAEVTFHTGWLSHRLALKTPRKHYHCWVSRDADEELLERVTAYVRDRMPEAPYESEPEAKEAEFMYRGQPVTREQHPGLPDEPPSEGDSTPNATARADDGDPSESTSGDSESADGNERESGAAEAQFMYRGQPVTREQHPGLPDEPPANTDSGSEEGDTPPEKGDGTTAESDSSESSADADGHLSTDGDSDHGDEQAPGGRPTT